MAASDPLSRLFGVIVPRAVDSVDLDAVLAEVDIDAILTRVDIDALLQRVDIDAIVQRVDIDAVVRRVDVDAIVQRVDIPAILDRVDIDTIVERRLQHVRPRWEDRPAVWERLSLTAESEDFRETRDFNLRSLQLVTGELWVSTGR